MAKLDVFKRLDQDDGVRRLAEQAHGLVVTRVADEDDGESILHEPARFRMDLAHERTGGIDDDKMAFGGHCADRR